MSPNLAGASFRVLCMGSLLFLPLPVRDVPRRLRSLIPRNSPRLHLLQNWDPRALRLLPRRKLPIGQHFTFTGLLTDPGQ
jgi:hypothetical protein